MSQTISGSPQLIPYPDWRSNAVGDCANGLNTVYRIKVDKVSRRRCITKNKKKSHNVWPIGEAKEKIKLTDLFSLSLVH